MASAHSTRRSVVPRLMATVRQLTPAELREFKQRFADWQQANGEEAALVDVCRSRLPAADERRLKTLISKSERDALRPPELQEYRRLVRRAEKLDATRLAALTQLASRWGQPVPHVMRGLGILSGATTFARPRAEGNGKGNRGMLESEPVGNGQPAPRAFRTRHPPARVSV